jgi:hypothetical protein
MGRLRVDEQAATLTVRTRATGMLARLAHDLEIEAERVTGAAEIDGTRWHAELRVAARSLRVTGVVRSGSVDRAVLSRADREEIERRLHGELIGDEVRVRAEGDALDRGRALVTVAREQALELRLETESRPHGGYSVVGRAELSLRALGVPEVKGPLGAFKVDDRLEARFWLVLLPLDETP